MVTCRPTNPVFASRKKFPSAYRRTSERVSSSDVKKAAALTSTGMVAASLSALGALGGFVEIGKRGIWTARGVHTERADVRFQLVAVDFLPPPVLGAAFDALAATLSGGFVHALPSMSHTVGRTRQAFVVMARAQHVGKVVVQVPSVAQVRSDGAWLVTGGLGMLGLMMADWLREYGAAHLALVSRSGRAADAAASSTTDHHHAVVRLARCDVARRAEATHSLTVVLRPSDPRPTRSSPIALDGAGRVWVVNPRSTTRTRGGRPSSWA